MGTGTVDIEVEAVPVLTYAMAHNRIAVVRRVRLRNNGDELRGARLVAEVRDAQGRLSQPFETVVDLPTGTSLELRDLDLQLDPAAMAQVEEHRPGRLTVEVLDADSWSAASVSRDLTIHAASHWSMEPLGLGLELLPAHVMPNSPEVTTVLRAASDLLDERTGSPSIEGYQSGEERVDQIVRAVFDALQALRITYANPPASWTGRAADVGQKVRTPKDVIGDRIGTCLDLTVVMAACLEQAGIRPLLWIVQGHAFLGWWRVERDLGTIALTDPNEAINYVDLKQMGLVETTMLTKRLQAVDFDTASRVNRVEQLADPSTVLGVVDVWRARRNAVYPLPAQARADDGTSYVVEYSPAQHSAPTLVVTGGRASTPGGAAEKVPPRVTAWKNALLDLTLRNQLLNFTNRYGLSLSMPTETIGLVEDLVHAETPIHLLPSDSVDEVLKVRGIHDGRQLPDQHRADLLRSDRALYTNVTTASYLTRMRALAYKARTIIEESGANNLYLALGTLVWTLDKRELRSPLVLVPIRLTTKGKQGGYRLELDESGESTPNYCLLEKLRQVHGMTIPGLADPEPDESGIDLTRALDAVRVAVMERGLPFRVEESADVAILQFAKFRLWKDLDDSWATFEQNALVRHLIRTPNLPFDDGRDVTEHSDLDALAAQCPVPADSSQLTAIADAVSGRTFVLEGPPGTGKSQTITNLLAKAMGEGRRVLFVAEKRAALDVVKSRLDAVGMGPFSLDLHDKGSKPAVVRGQIRAALDEQPQPDRQAVKSSLERHVSSARRLSRYAKRLHDENDAGQSLYSATTDLLQRGPDGPAFDVPARLLSLGSTVERDYLRAGLETLPEVAELARPGANHPWGFITVDALGEEEITTVQRASAAADDALSRLAGVTPLAAVLDAVTRPDELVALGSLLRSSDLELETLDRTRSAQWRADSASVRSEIHTFVAAAHPGLDVATPEALHLPLPDIYARAQAAATSSWFGRKKRLRAVAIELAPGLRPGTTVEPKGVLALVTALVQLQGAVQHLSTKSSGVVGVRVPAGWNPLTDNGAQVVAQQLEWLEWAGAVVATDTASRFTLELRSVVQRRYRPEPETVALVESLGTALRQVLTSTAARDDDLTVWRRDQGLLGRWQATATLRKSMDEQLTSLRRWLDLRRALAPLDRAGMRDAVQSVLSGAVDAEDARGAFEKGLSITSQHERLSEQGLDTFDPTSHERSIRTYVDTGRELRHLLHEVIPADAVNRRDFVADSESGQIGALRREVNKSRRGLTVRALMDTYADLVTQLLPCVLVSPDSLARFFPARAGLFDLVVFDEASQIRVADAVGAMGRATSVVVVGDSKQMPPTSVGQSAADDLDSVDSSSEDLVDSESILSECVDASVPRQWLSWHYRSQDESLIAFSNAHYYKDRLSSFPSPRTDPEISRCEGYGVGLVRTHGEFLRTGKGKLLRTNPIEASAIVTEISRRFAASPDTLPSIGVVTFNLQQRAYIEALIRDGSDARMVEALDADGEGIFVKNLENVQGDERDVIFFSTGFSVNDKGVLPLNFGPLIQSGGERRLNVAVTRARREVLVFTSFEPAQLRADETTNQGLKDLRAYLELADAGTQTLEAARLRRPGKDLHREDVATALRERGYVVDTAVGLSDFRVDLAVARPDQPQRYLAAVLLDGPEWGSRATIGDRDSLPVEVLQRLLHWPLVCRVWLPAWLADRGQVLDRITRELEGAQLTPVDAAMAPTTSPDGPSPPAFESPSYETPRVADSRDHAPNDLLADNAHDPWSAVLVNAAKPAGPVASRPDRTAGTLRATFVPWRSRARGGRDVLDDLAWSPVARERIRQAAIDIIEHEQAIHEERLVKLVATDFDLSRVQAARASAILQQVPGSHRKGNERAILWGSTVEPSQWSAVRVDEDASRTIEQIPLREIANVMTAICTDSGGAGRQELHRGALATFGMRRLTQRIEARMDQALLMALEEYRLEEANNNIYRAPRS